MLVRALLVIDDASVRRRLRGSLEELDILVTEVPAGDRFWERLGHETFDLLITTPGTLPPPVESSIAQVRNLPEHPEVILLSDEEDLEARANLLAAGALAVVSHSLGTDSLQETLSAFIERQRGVGLEQVKAERELDRSTLGDFSSKSPAMRALLGLARKVAPADTSLLILGETGVGKEWLGRAIHAESPRARGPFIAVNPAALPEQLLESELFGHEKGAFTGATRARRGAFELAHGGTMFLDEIGDMPPHLQVKLLRVLQERQIRRLGSERSIQVDVRIMAATHQNIGSSAEESGFRQDLYYRLSVMTLTVPALRDRPEDIPPLVETYLARFRTQLSRPEISGTSLEAMKALQKYSWPGNVRELINVMERAVLLCEGALITLAELPDEISGAVTPGRPDAAAADLDIAAFLERPLSQARDEILRSFEVRYLSRLLSESQGNVGLTAKRAGVDPRTLYNKMKLYGLRKEEFKQPTD